MRRGPKYQTFALLSIFELEHMPQRVLFFSIRIMYLFLPLIVSTTAMAEEGKTLHATFEARADFQHQSIERKSIKKNNGFKGYIVDVILKGDISSNFSYAYRQRFNEINKDAAFFDSIDLLYLDYKSSKNICFSAGKKPVFVGGWESDLAPIDCYYLSEFCYHFDCYQWGISIDYASSNDKDHIMAQICQSPFRSTYSKVKEEAANMYAYNLIWHGNHGFFVPIWSVNQLEYAPGKYINYISLGNLFRIEDKFQLNFDFMNRTVSIEDIFGKDFSIVSQLSYQPIRQLNLFTKVSCDINKTDSHADLCISSGTDLYRVGGGFEIFPLRDSSVRIHGFYSYSFGKNTHAEAVVVDKLSILNFGVSWRINAL